MEGITKTQVDDEKYPVERRGSIKHRNENDGDDEGATWSISSNGGISRSSHDDEFVFQSKYIFILIFLKKNSILKIDVSTDSDKLSE